MESFNLQLHPSFMSSVSLSNNIEIRKHTLKGYEINYLMPCNQIGPRTVLVAGYRRKALNRPEKI